MRLVILHAQLDSSSDEVVSSLSHADPLRLALGDKPSSLRFGAGARVVVIWGAAALALGWERFAALLGADAQVLIVSTDDTPPPRVSQRIQVLRWNIGLGGARLLAALSSSGDGAEEAGEGGLLNAASKGAVAGLAAAVGVLAAGSAPVAAAPSPIAISRREETQQRAAERETERQPQAVSRAQVKQTVAAIDLGSEETESVGLGEAAEALAAEWVQNQAVKRPISNRVHDERSLGLGVPGAS